MKDSSRAVEKADSKAGSRDFQKVENSVESTDNRKDVMMVDSMAALKAGWKAAQMVNSKAGLKDSQMVENSAESTD